MLLSVQLLTIPDETILSRLLVLKQKKKKKSRQKNQGHQQRFVLGNICSEAVNRLRYSDLIAEN